MLQGCAAIRLFIPVSPRLDNFRREAPRNSYSCCSTGRTIFPLASIRIFSLSDFLQFEYEVPRCSFFFSIFLSSVLWISWKCGLGIIIIALNISSVLFCLLLRVHGNVHNFHYIYATPFVIVPPFLNILFQFFCLFSLCFSVWDVSIDISSGSLTLCSAVCSLPMNP